MAERLKAYSAHDDPDRACRPGRRTEEDEPVARLLRVGRFVSRRVLPAGASRVADTPGEGDCHPGAGPDPIRVRAYIARRELTASAENIEAGSYIAIEDVAGHTAYEMSVRDSINGTWCGSSASTTTLRRCSTSPRRSSRSRGSARLGRAWFGLAGTARQIRSRLGRVRLGSAGFGRHGTVRHGPVRRSWPGFNWHGPVRQGPVRHGPAGRGSARHGRQV